MANVLIGKYGYREDQADTAAADALTRYREACTAGGYDLPELVDVQVIRTPEHEAAGAFLLRLAPAKRGSKR